MAENNTELLEENVSSEVIAETSEPPAKRRKKLSRNYVLLQNFENIDEAKLFLKNLSTWSYYKTNTDAKGNSSLSYRCNKVQRRQEQCMMAMKIVIPAEGQEVGVYQSEEQHSCATIATKSTVPLSFDHQTLLRQMIDLDPKITPNVALRKLSETSSLLPSKTQLSYFISNLKRQREGPSTVSLSELWTMCENFSAEPESRDKGFVLAKQFDFDAQTFRIAISSKTLLELSTKRNHLHADATYKVNWNGFPLIVIGTTDRHRKFHAVLICISSNETSVDYAFAFGSLKDGVEVYCDSSLQVTTIVSDAAGAISKGAKEVFGDQTVIIMCWFHVLKAARKKMPIEHCAAIVYDLKVLQLAPSVKIFDQASSLFVEKWSEIAPNFITDFKTTWLDQNRNWFEGAMRDTPGTNNPEEGFFGNFKRDFTQRKRVGIGRFFNAVIGYVDIWSNDYKIGVNTFQETKEISMDLWQRSYAWKQLNKQVFVVRSSNGDVHYTFCGTTFTGDAKTYDASFSSFAEYSSKRFEIHVSVINGKDFLKGHCSCPVYLKTDLCKHLVGIAIRNKWIVCPDAAKAVPLGEKKKRGRPALAKKALLTQ
jgi:hypothetical protein